MTPFDRQKVILWHLSDLSPRSFAMPHHTRPRARPHRLGFTLVEELVVLTTLGLLATVAVLGGAPVLDAVVVESAGRETATLFALARDHALAAGVRTAVQLDDQHAAVTVHAAGDTIARSLFDQTGVHMAVTRDSMAYAATGLGLGASNLRIILSRGARADTITVSRLGRVQR
jgi:type II secretory pathway pseudopilin PulG